jgi:hypothetical protein
MRGREREAREVEEVKGSSGLSFDARGKGVRSVESDNGERRRSDCQDAHGPWEGDSLPFLEGERNRRFCVACVMLGFRLSLHELPRYIAPRLPAGSHLPLQAARSTRALRVQL